MKARFVLAAAIAMAAAFASAAPKAPTRVDVSAQPDGAEVSVDGEARGLAPLSIFDLKPGPHHFHISAKGHRAEDAFVDVVAGDFIQKHFSLVREKGLLLVKTDPPGADVKAYATSLGNTPLLITTLDTDASYTLDLSLAGYQSKRIEVRLDGRTPVVREESLMLDSGSVDCTSDPSGAEVFVNGISRGFTPTTVQHVPKGVATVMFKLRGHDDESREIRLAPGDKLSLAVKMKPRPAKLTVVTVPEGARVFFDGNYQGKSPAVISQVDAGEHEVRVETSGHAELKRKVFVSPGTESTEEFRLASVLGRLEITTAPAAARVFLDGHAVGATKLKGDAKRSGVLAVEGIEAGIHSVMVRAPGFQDVARKIKFPAAQTTTLNVRLSRVFTPDTELDTTHGIFRGVLVSNTDAGLVLETKPGVEQTFRHEDIRKIVPLIND